MQREIQEIAKLIQEKESFLVTSHRNVDGDAYGATIALFLLLKKLGKQVEAVNELPIPPLYHFLGFHHLVNKAIERRNPDVIFIGDCGEPKLAGKIYDENIDVFIASTIVNIDHHNGNFHYGAINLVDPEASSTCELISELIFATPEFLAVLDADIATALLYGIFRDSNCYKNGVRPRTFELTAKLIEYGARYSQMVFETYKQEPLNYLSLYGHAINHVLTLREGRVVGTYISQADFQKYEVREEELGPQFINEILSSIKWADYVFLIKETESWDRKLSFRIRHSGFDVSKIAVRLGGGGHKWSAAAYTNLSIDEILKIIEETDIAE